MPENFPDEKRVIGIRDKDYQTKKRFERIFYCDYCCCEMMLVSDDETFEKLAVNFYRGKLPYSKLRYEILSKLFYLSVVRLCSDRYRWGLRNFRYRFKQNNQSALKPHAGSGNKFYQRIQSAQQNQLKTRKTNCLCQKHG